MSWSEFLAGMNAAVFANVGDGLATWPGVALPVWIIVRRPDVIQGLGLSEALAQGTFIEVQRSDVPNPQIRDQVVFGETTFKIIADPQKGDDGSIWVCEAVEI